MTHKVPANGAKKNNEENECFRLRYARYSAFANWIRVFVLPADSLIALMFVVFDNYLTSAFGYGEIGGSVAMLVIGLALATSSTFLVKPVQKRVDKRRIIGASLLVMVGSALAWGAPAIRRLTERPGGY